MNAGLIVRAGAPRARLASRISTVARTHSIFASLIVSILLFALPVRANAWDSHTHMLIARLAVDALPESPLKRTLEAHEADLQEDAVAPDEVLRARYGKAEAIRHYIDLEYYGADPFAALKPDRAAMEREYGAGTLEKSGTLPWTIEEMAQGIQQAWRKGDCAQVIVLSGYLAHYVGDATQPLHSTKYYDGYPQDRGMHARLEGAVDRSVGEVEQLARPQVRVVNIDSAWSAAITELRHGNPLVAGTVDADRAARAETGAKRGDDFDRALMRREMAMVAHQVAEAASMLASIWLYEWNQAGSPATCAH
jgi:hypothetical protein